MLYEGQQAEVVEIIHMGFGGLLNLLHKLIITVDILTQETQQLIVMLFMVYQMLVIVLTLMVFLDNVVLLQITNMLDISLLVVDPSVVVALIM